MPTPPQEDEPLREEDRPGVREPRAGGASPLMPRRATSPRSSAEGGTGEKRFVDYKMEAAPS